MNLGDSEALLLSADRCFRDVGGAIATLAAGIAQSLTCQFAFLGMWDGAIAKRTEGIASW
jgi:hypothetical protein